MRARSTAANITPTLAGAILLCLCSQARGQTDAQTQTFIIHGTPQTCGAITQLDSALLADSPQFFAGWTESDYVDAVAWSQACSQYGWQVPWRPRIPLLQAQHDRALRSAQTQTVQAPAIPAPAQIVPTVATVLPNTAVQAAVAPPAQAVPSAAPADVLPNAPVQAADAAPAQIVPTVPTVLPSTAVQAVVAPPAQVVPSTATAYVLPSAAVQAAPAQAVPSAATASVPPNAPVQAADAAPAQVVRSAAPADVPPSAAVQAVPVSATGSALPSRIRNQIVSDGEEDSLLTDNYYKDHFHQESLWVAKKANLDIGEDGASSSWPSNGIPSQMKNRLTADRIVLYCARKTNSGESGKRPLLWDLRWCEAEEASAYKRLVSGNEFPTAGRAVVLSCAGVDSYIYLERCMATLTEAGMH